MANKSRECWVAVNKNGFISLFVKQPTRNEKTGKWECELYLDSVVYNIMKDIITKSNFNWENEPEFFSFENKPKEE